MTINIRNFSIIAHINHGKSTLADRIIEICTDVKLRNMSDQVLDSMDLERERGITIKAQTVRLNYKSQNGTKYVFNLIDTPGHVDFGYEVSRSLAACEGALLVIDASQGIEAQTLANAYKAIENNLEIILVLNKIDLSIANPNKIKQEVKDIIGLDIDNTIEVSAKTGDGINLLLEAIVKILPPPKYIKNMTFKAMLVDSWYDRYLGTVILLKIISGNIKRGIKIKIMSSNVDHIVTDVGIFTPKKKIIKNLSCGEVGFIILNVKKVIDCCIGDIITDAVKPTMKILLKHKSSKPVIFCGFYPVDMTDFSKLKNSMAKLQLNDSSFIYEVESSKILGFGFRCGFLGMLHLEITQERLIREYKMEFIVTVPSVIYRVHLKLGAMIQFYNPDNFPENDKINFVEEPWIQITIITPSKYLGSILVLCNDKRGIQENINYIGTRVLVIYRMPLNEIIFHFYDRLKSVSKGYATCDWEMFKYIKSKIIKVSILINGLNVNALSSLAHISKAKKKGQELCLRLKALIPKHLFAIPIQAMINGKIVVRETITALRKNVTAKCYGGDITRKKKLLSKQKKGKKLMQSIGSVNVPKSVFISVFKLNT